MMFGAHIKSKINDALNEESGPMRCPICGYNYAHVSIRVLSSAETGTRQGGYAVVLNGECGHTWGDVYAEHKGQVVKAAYVSEVVPAEKTKE